MDETEKQAWKRAIKPRDVRFAFKTVAGRSDMLLLRQNESACERVETSGGWLI